MTTAQTLLNEARRWRLRISARDGKIIVAPARNCPPEFANLLREHKEEVLDLLAAQKDGLQVDQAPWLHVARQVLAGEFNGADDSTRQSLIIGLRSISHPVCRRALERLGVEPKGQQ